MKPLLRTALCALGLLAALLGSGPAHAQDRPHPTDTPGIVDQQRGRVIGQIVALLGPKGNPTGVTLRLGTDTTDIDFASAYTLDPQSAEAEVQGLAIGDYANVLVRKVGTDWIARRVQFDVQPFGRLNVFIGTVTSVTPDGRHFRMRLVDTGQVRLLTIVRITRFRSNGKTLDTAATLDRGTAVQVLVLRERLNIIAVDVTIRPGAALSRF